MGVFLKLIDTADVFPNNMSISASIGTRVVKNLLAQGAVVMTNENWASTVETIKGTGIPVFDFPETGVQMGAVTGVPVWSGSAGAR